MKVSYWLATFHDCDDVINSKGSHTHTHTHTPVSFMPWCTCCLMNKKLPHTSVLCCHLGFFNRPSQIHFVDVFIYGVFLCCSWPSTSSSMGRISRVQSPGDAGMRCMWPNHFKRLFLMTDVSWGCLVLDLMLSFEICWNSTKVAVCKSSGHRFWPIRMPPRPCSLCLATVSDPYGFFLPPQKKKKKDPCQIICICVHHTSLARYP